MFDRRIGVVVAAAGVHLAIADEDGGGVSEVEGGRQAGLLFASSAASTTESLSLALFPWKR